MNDLLLLIGRSLRGLWGKIILDRRLIVSGRALLMLSVRLIVSWNLSHLSCVLLYWLLGVWNLLLLLLLISRNRDACSKVTL